MFGPVPEDDREERAVGQAVRLKVVPAVVVEVRVGVLGDEDHEHARSRSPMPTMSARPIPKPPRPLVPCRPRRGTRDVVMLGRGSVGSCDGG